MQYQPIYFVAEAFEQPLYNAGIVRMHQEKILRAEGCTPLVFRYSDKQAVWYKMLRVIQCCRIAFSLPKHSKLLFHFPLQASIYSWLLTILQLRGISTVALIIDIDGLRNNDNILLEQEMKQLKKISLLVAHNRAMKEKLLQQLPSSKISCIELFDYPVKISSPVVQKSGTVCFAGNLTKAMFVYNLNQVPATTFFIYGPYPDISFTQSDHVIFKGVISPDELPAKLEGSFGLVWDGNSLEEADKYLHYNNPHKLSLYLTAGLPVIVWDQSASAAFVKLHDIGFTVKSIGEIPGKIQQISDERYNTMHKNALAIGVKTTGGYFLKSVLVVLKTV